MANNKQNVSPRVKVVQKLYGNSLNSSAEIEFPRSQYFPSRIGTPNWEATAHGHPEHALSAT